MEAAKTFLRRGWQRNRCIQQPLNGMFSKAANNIQSQLCKDVKGNGRLQIIIAALIEWYFLGIAFQIGLTVSITRAVSLWDPFGDPDSPRCGWKS